MLFKLQFTVAQPKPVLNLCLTLTKFEAHALIEKKFYKKGALLDLFDLFTKMLSYIFYLSITCINAVDNSLYCLHIRFVSMAY